MRPPEPPNLRLILAIGLASGLTWAVCKAVGLSAAAPYGVVIAALLIRPDFQPWPAKLIVALPLVVIIGLGLGTALKPLIGAAEVWQFAVVTIVAQVLGQALPDSAMALRNLLAVLAVLPLLSSSATWLTAWQQLLAVLTGLLAASLIQTGMRLPDDATAGEAAEPAAMALPERALVQRFSDPYFWRKLVVSSLALSVGVGLGATNPKYLYFGVVLLLNDSLGATLARVRDRMVGVSLGVLMPWLVVNTMPINSLTVAVVMAGTATLLPALGLASQLRTALISSAVTFVGYGVLTDWYIPTRWIDYLLGCALALLVCLLVRPSSALRRLQREARPGEELAPALRALLPSALEEARVLGQERAFQELLERLKPQLPEP